MDQEFDKVEGKLGLVEVNTSAACEDVGEIERMIRVVKERYRAITTTLPYSLLPKQMVTHSSNFQSRVAQKINAKQLMKPKTAIERAVNGTLPNSRRTKRNGDI